MGRLIFYDTSNYVDFPIGGQLTSVSNLLRYLCESHPERVKDIVLVGVTIVPEEVGKMRTIERFGQRLTFFPVTLAESDQGHTAHSLRLRFVKGLLRYGRQLRLRKDDCNYIQTPEAYGPIKVLRPGSKCVIYSHGSYANMDQDFRFFRKNVLLRKAFGQYLKWLLRGADLIFILDENSRQDYLPYNKKLVMAHNTIVLPEDYDTWKPHPYGKRLVYVGRISPDKGVEGIVRSMEYMPDGQKLTMVGDGLQRDELEALAKELRAAKTKELGSDPGDDFIRFTGGVAPARVGGLLDKADILVMNSPSEGVPMVILEAFSHGLPIVSTDVGGIGATVNFGTDAEKTEGTPKTLAEAVQKVAAAYESYAVQAHAHAMDYSYAVANARIYEELAKFWK